MAFPHSTADLTSRLHADPRRDDVAAQSVLWSRAERHGDMSLVLTGAVNVADGISPIDPCSFTDTMVPMGGTGANL
jgi:hypothetical protein